jgi:small subunit ribosomal protein S1
LAEHQAGDTVTGRIVEVLDGSARVEVGEGIQATCRISMEPTEQTSSASSTPGKPDLAALGSMLQARWKSGPTSQPTKPQEMRAGQVRSFRITKIDPTAKKIELELAKSGA